MRPDNYNPFSSPIKNVDSISLGLIRKKSKILDLGCGDGSLSKIMKNQLGCQVIGVELNKNYAQKASKRADKIIQGNIEDFKIQKRVESFSPYDIIFASAILEHLVDPHKTLQFIKPLISPKGYFIITLPNIAHYSARLEIAKGKFDYKDSGLLDKTHLHFFTTETAPKFLKRSGLTIMSTQYEYFAPKYLKLLFPYFPNLFTYQMIFKAKNK